MSTLTLKKNPSFSSGEITLPYSKSLSNRALIIRELCDGTFNIDHLSESEDTQNLLQVLSSDTNVVNVGPAGTNMRFLTSLFALQPGLRQLSGSIRLNQRPIGDLVNCLNQLGAEIFYMGNVGYPPLRIVGTHLKGGKIDIDSSASSQFVSSILMIAPYVEDGIELSIRGSMVSEPYISMTLKLMKYFGVEHERIENTIHIKEGKYIPKDYSVEGDWSSAANWYGYIATSPIGTKLLLRNLQMNSLQGDKKCAAYFTGLGVDSITTENGIEIIKKTEPATQIQFDLKNEPDLFPPLAATCAALKIPAGFEGLDTLTLKESDRIKSLAKELKKLNIQSEFTETTFRITAFGKTPLKATFETYEDHRIAMALSILLQNEIEIKINDPHVVGKSYPGFWDDLKSVGIANIY